LSAAWLAKGCVDADVVSGALACATFHRVTGTHAGQGDDERCLAGSDAVRGRAWIHSTTLRARASPVMEWENRNAPEAGDACAPDAGDDLRDGVDHDGPETPPRHPAKLMLLHWLTVLCLLLAATLILTRDQVAGRALRMWLLEGHRNVGLCVLALFFARVALRFRPRHLIPADRAPRLLGWLATLNHLALYALLLAQPLLGWALSDAQGKPVHLLGAKLPALVMPDEDLADALQGWHQWAAWLLLGLILLHVGAALWHHFVLRDGVLRRMLPPRR
jgi:cytochrome b561